MVISHAKFLFESYRGQVSLRRRLLPRVKALSIDGRPSVCLVPDTTSRTEELSKLKIDRMEAHDTDDL